MEWLRGGWVSRLLVGGSFLEPPELAEPHSREHTCWWGGGLASATVEGKEMRMRLCIPELAHSPRFAHGACSRIFWWLGHCFNKYNGWQICKSVKFD